MTARQQAGMITLEAVTDLASSFPSLELAPTRVLHSGVHTKKVTEVMPVPELETDKVINSQRQEELPPEVTPTGTDGRSLGYEPGDESVTKGAGQKQVGVLPVDSVGHTYDYEYAAKRGRKPRRGGL